jgi:non-lysosomal glucosylceramidase
MRNKTAKIMGLLLAVSAAAAAGQAADGLYLKHYDQQHLAQIALPIGGIGTGTVSLGGRGDLRDWEIANRPAKGFNPGSPFFAIRGRSADGRIFARALTGSVEPFQYAGTSGVKDATNPGLPTFRACSFDAGYPFGRVNLSDADLPVKVRVRAFNPLVPADTEASGIPIAVLTYDVENLTDKDLQVTVCGTLQNFIGDDGVRALAAKNRNEFRSAGAIKGIFMSSEGVAKDAETWGTMALSTPDSGGISYRTAWSPQGWGTSLLEFWDDLVDDGQLTDLPVNEKEARPRASLAVQASVPARGTRSFTFFLTWHFPNRFAWSPTVVGNYYTTRYVDAWDAAVKTHPKMAALEAETAAFVGAFLKSDLPEVVKEAALFNLSTLRTQTCFRTADGRFYAWEGCGDKEGCCWGSCTHVWNYEQAIAFLFGSVARSLREIEFGPETDATGLMSFRAKLPIDGPAWGKAAADGQMGCILKMYRDWQLSGDKALLAPLWPKVKKAIEFCWIKGGWDADKDGVMEGCQHNTMDVEYYGPNPQMGLWYLGALRAGEEIAKAMGDKSFAATCRSLFESGSRWIDANLFNGRYYIHKVVPPMNQAAIAPSLLVGMGSTDFVRPDYQLANGCLVDQLVGQFMAHVCGLGYLVKPENVKTTLASIMTYNHRDSLADHFNVMRSFALGDEAALLMADYPDGRPANPFPYFTEVMTGFEYTAAIGMLYEGQTESGLRCIADIRNRYDGLRRSPYDEAECGHHYGRAMISWGAVLALSGFQYSAVDKTLAFAGREGVQFWSNGYAYGTAAFKRMGKALAVTVEAIKGELPFKTFTAAGFGKAVFPAVRTAAPGLPVVFEVAADAKAAK